MRFLKFFSLGYWLKSKSISQRLGFQAGSAILLSFCLVAVLAGGSYVSLGMIQKDNDLAGQDALVIGRSNIVGKPMAQLLLQESCTVTIAHSRTRDLPALCRHADIVIAAVGRPEMVRGDWLKPGAVVIDVGINRLPGEGDKARLVGDVAFAEAREVAGAITPVPGGVGPMTIACLLRNTVVAACRQAGVACQLV